MLINVHDNVITMEENNSLYDKIVYGKNFRYGEIDDVGRSPTGLVHDMQPEDDLYVKLHNIVCEKNEKYTNAQLQRAYINMFLPNERPYFHIDGDVTTFLFYINPLTNLDEGGETQFLIDDNVVNVWAVPCRLVEFDGTLLHKATSFRSIPRITVALKFDKIKI